MTQFRPHVLYGKLKESELINLIKKLQVIINEIMGENYMR